MAEVQWHSISLAPVILITGKEMVLASRALDRIKEQAKAKYPELEIQEFQAGSFTQHDLAQYTAPSLFADPKLILLQELANSSEQLVTALIEYLQNPEPNVTMVLVHKGEQRGKKLLDAFKKSPYPWVKAGEIKSAKDKLTFATSEFTRAKRRITEEAVKSLVDAFGNDLLELAAIAQQLISDTQPSAGENPGPITINDVNKLTAGRSETTVYQIADAALAGNQRVALALLRQAEKSGVNANKVVGALAGKAREVAIVSTPGVNAKSLGMLDWKYRLLNNLARGFTDRGLAAAIEAIAKTDAAIKGAERDPAWALQRLIIELSHARKIK